MTIEEKARAYDEALERAQRATRAGSDVAMDIVQYIFPQLCESEDERTVNEIIAFVEQAIHRGVGTPIPKEKEDRWIAYLEKQKEKLDYLSVNRVKVRPDGGTERHTIGYLEKREEQKPAEWSKEDTIHLTNAILSAEREWGKDSYTAKWLNALPNRFILQPKQEWSEEDGQHLNSVCSYLDSYIQTHEKDSYGVEECKYLKYWLKSLSLKKRLDDVDKLCSNEWSEEDERHLKNLLAYFSGIEKTSPYYEDFVWFKSLRPQPKRNCKECAMFLCGECTRPHWKPSEEQMKALKECGECKKAIAELYEHYEDKR